MSRVKTISLSGVTADDNGIAESQTPAAGGEQSLTLTGTNPPVPMLIDITTAADETSRTFVITGTDRYGEIISENVTGVDTGVAQSTKQFATVTSITVDDDTAGAIIVGWAAVVYSAWIPLETVFEDIRQALAVIVSGTVSFDLQYTYMNMFDRASAKGIGANPLQYGDIEALAGAEAFVDSDIDDDTSTVAKTLTARATAIRFKLNSGTGSLTGRLTQAGNR